MAGRDAESGTPLKQSMEVNALTALLQNIRAAHVLLLERKRVTGDAADRSAPPRAAKDTAAASDRNDNPVASATSATLPPDYDGLFARSPSTSPSIARENTNLGAQSEVDFTGGAAVGKASATVSSVLPVAEIRSRDAAAAAEARNRQFELQMQALESRQQKQHALRAAAATAGGPGNPLGQPWGGLPSDAGGAFGVGHAAGPPGHGRAAGLLAAALRASRSGPADPSVGSMSTPSPFMLPHAPVQQPQHQQMQQPQHGPTSAGLMPGVGWQLPHRQPLAQPPLMQPQPHFPMARPSGLQLLPSMPPSPLQYAGTGSDAAAGGWPQYAAAHFQTAPPTLPLRGGVLPTPQASVQYTSAPAGLGLAARPPPPRAGRGNAATLPAWMSRQT